MTMVPPVPSGYPEPDENDVVFQGARPVICIRNFHPDSVFVQSIAVFAVSFDCFSANKNGGRVNVRTGASSTGNRAVP